MKPQLKQRLAAHDVEQPSSEGIYIYSRKRLNPADYPQACSKAVEQANLIMDFGGTTDRRALAKHTSLSQTQSLMVFYKEFALFFVILIPTVLVPIFRSPGIMGAKAFLTLIGLLWLVAIGHTLRLLTTQGSREFEPTGLEKLQDRIDQQKNDVHWDVLEKIENDVKQNILQEITVEETADFYTLDANERNKALDNLIELNELRAQTKELTRIRPLSKAEEQNILHMDQQLAAPLKQARSKRFDEKVNTNKTLAHVLREPAAVGTGDVDYTSEFPLYDPNTSEQTEVSKI